MSFIFATEDFLLSHYADALAEQGIDVDALDDVRRDQFDDFLTSQSMALTEYIHRAVDAFVADAPTVDSIFDDLQ